MSNMDLIPQVYRTRRWQSLWVKRTVVLLGVLVGILFAGSMALGIATDKARERVTALQHHQSVTAQQRAELQELDAEKTDLQGQFRLLSGLRSGAAAEKMFVTVDRALTSDDVWFLEWQFKRAGVVVGEEARTVNTGYFIVVPDGADKSDADDLRVQTHMTIQGQARDHSALSGFVRRLFAQTEIDDVRIRRTALNRGNQQGTVDFDLAIVLNTDVRIE
jgi:Tfp pilus assembly protein PilN